MYTNISESIRGLREEDVVESYEEAYNKLYRLVTRLEDMDNFDNNILLKIRDRMKEYDDLDENLAFQRAFKEIIDNDYEFSDFDYFKPAFDNQYVNLFDSFKKAIKSKSPENSWRHDIDWYASHLTLTVDGIQYTLNDLMNKVK